MSIPTVRGLLCDMNGLFRHWRNKGASAGEARAGLPAGTLHAYAYEHPTYRLAKAGVITDQQWADGVKQRLAADFGSGSAVAIEPWRLDRGERDEEMIALLANARKHVPVGVISNTTDAFGADMEHHNLTNAFDFLLPSAELGVEKPSPHAYLAAADRMGMAPEHLFYTDDEPTFVVGAAHVGMQAELFTGPANFARSLQRCGIQVLYADPRAQRVGIGQ